MKLLAQPINCTLKADAGQSSSTDAMIGELKKAFSAHDVEVARTIRIAAHNVAPGVTSDEGKGDEWPGIRAKILASVRSSARLAIHGSIRA